MSGISTSATGDVTLAGDNEFTGTNTFNSSRPTSTIASTPGSTNLITKQNADALYAPVAVDGDVKLNGNPNAFTGTNTFNSNRPTSTLTATPGSTDFITKQNGEALFAPVSVTGDVTKNGGTEASPQTFVGFNKFNNDVDMADNLLFTGAASGGIPNIRINGVDNFIQMTGDIKQVSSASKFTTNGGIAMNVLTTNMTHPVQFDPASGTGGFVVFETGNVGIGTTTDEGGRLMVYGSGNAEKRGLYRMFRVIGNNTGGTGSQSGVNDVGSDKGSSTTIGGDVGIYANHRIYADRGFFSQQGTLEASDIRIKNNIEDLQEGECIEKLKKLRPLKYGYKDVVGRGTAKVYGFIAQEVINVLPESIEYQTTYIPDIYKGCDVSGDILKIDDYDVNDLSINTNLRLIDDYDREDFIKVVDIDVSNNSVKINKTITEDKQFCYGRRIEDFHYIGKDHIWTITTASVIELIKRVETLEAQIKTLI